MEIYEHFLLLQRTLNSVLFYLLLLWEIFNNRDEHYILNEKFSFLRRFLFFFSGHNSDLGHTLQLEMWVRTVD